MQPGGPNNIYFILLFRNSSGQEAQFQTPIVSTGKNFVTVYRSVLDPHWFNADSDPAFYLSAEPDPGIQNYRMWIHAVPDPGPGQTVLP